MTVQWREIQRRRAPCAWFETLLCIMVFERKGGDQLRSDRAISQT